MSGVNISDYQENRLNSRGKCKGCHKVVTWSRERLSAHKRSSCLAATSEEEQIILKRTSESTSTKENPNESSATFYCHELLADKVKEIN